MKGIFQCFSGKEFTKGDQETESIKEDEMMDAIRKLKSDKVPGRVHITTEMIKNMGEEVTKD